MIKEVLGLGIKGQDIILSTLKKIQKEKDQFKKSVTVGLGLGGGRGPSFQQAPAPSGQGQEEQTKKFNSVASDILGGLQSVGHGLATLQSGAALKGMIAGAGAVAQVAGGEVVAPWITAIEQSANMLIDGAQNFVSQTKEAASIYADTADASNKAINFLAHRAGADTYTPEGKIIDERKGFLMSQRVDIDTNSQRAIVEGLGAKYGIVQDELRKSVERLFGKQGSETDINQARALSMGQFGALGTDKGFFMQKISDSFSGLPPSILQHLTAQMQGMLQTGPGGDLMQQNDVLARRTTAAFDRVNRDAAGLKMGGVDTALDLARTIATSDAALVNGMGDLVKTLKELTALISKKGGGDSGSNFIAGAKAVMGTK